MTERSHWTNPSGPSTDRITLWAPEGVAIPFELASALERAYAYAFDVVLSQRRRLRVRPGFDPATLLQLVRLLEEPPC